MIKNEKSLIDRAKNYAVKNNITVNDVLQNFMFERVLERISNSNYKNNFVFKGGVILSSIIGLSNRTTLDIDTSLKGLNVSDDDLTNIINEILHIDLNDNVNFNIYNYKHIALEQNSNGIEYKITGQFGKITINFLLDIVQDNNITPREIEYKYKEILEDKSIDILTYSVESMLSEKFYAIIKNGARSSRMKDYYDIYIMSKMKISKENLKIAIKNAFDKRNTKADIIEVQIEKIKNSKELSERWQNYRNSKSFARNIKFEDTLKALEKIKNIYNLQ